MDIVTEAIFLRAVKHGENNLVLQCFTDKAGRCSFFLKNAGKNVRHLLYPMNLIEITCVTRREGSMPLVKEISPATALNRIRSDIFRYSIAQYMAELLYRCIRENAADSSIFRLCKKTVAMLNDLDGNYSNLHLLFTASLTEALGYRPVVNRDEKSRPRFNITGAEFCNLPPGQETMDDRLSLILEKAFSADIEEFLTLKTSGAERSRFLEYMTRYLSLRMVCNLEIRSIEILNEIFR